MSLYNDGYSNRAVALGMGLANDQAQAVYTQNATNNLVATDTFQIGNSTFTIVSAIGSTPGNVLRGGSWAATMANIIAALDASVSGSGSTANYIPLATPADMYGVAGTGKVTFYARVPGAAGSGFPSVYTASGTSAGSFGAATAAILTNNASRAVDWTVALGLSIQFEIVAAIVIPAVFEVWSDIPSSGNPCNPSGIAANQAIVNDDDLCNPLTGAAIPMRITIPATATVSGLNIQGFADTHYISPVGAFIQGRPRCMGAGKFMYVRAISGDTANVNVTALLSRMKIAN